VNPPRSRKGETASPPPKAHASEFYPNHNRSLSVTWAFSSTFLIFFKSKRQKSVVAPAHPRTPVHPRLSNFGNAESARSKGFEASSALLRLGACSVPTDKLLRYSIAELSRHTFLPRALSSVQRTFEHTPLYNCSSNRLAQSVATHRSVPNC